MKAWNEQRDILIPALEGLFKQGEIAKEQEEELRKVFVTIRSADQDTFLPALKKFLILLAPESAWYLELHSLFNDIVDLGSRLTTQKTYYGIRFFATLAQEGFGKTPEQAEQFLKWLRKLFVLDTRLAFALLRGYKQLARRLEPPEVDRYIEEGLSCHEVNRRMGERFLALDLDNTEAVIHNLACECRLSDVVTELERLLLALTGHKIAVEALSALPSSSHLTRRPRMIAMQRQLYLPARVNRFAAKGTNRRWYLLLAVVGAAMLDFKSFPSLHGYPDYPSAKTLVGDSILNQNLFQILEYARVLAESRKHWPGCEGLIRFGIQEEVRHNSSERSGAEQLFFDLMEIKRQIGRSALNMMQSVAEARDDAERRHENLKMLEKLDRITKISTHLFETAEQISTLESEVFLQLYPDLDETLLRPLTFLPDFFYPGYLQGSSLEEGLLDVEASPPRQAPRFSPKRTRYKTVPGQPQILENRQTDGGAEDDSRCYLYDEWSQAEHRYLPGHCYVYEKKIPLRQEPFFSKELLEEGNKLRRIFEMLRPDDSRKEKRLPEGDLINEALLVEYMIRAKHEPSPKVDFFEQPAVRKRDIAVLLLLDVSGSTREQVNETRVIDIEKQAAVIFGQGLAALGDRFAICGFSSNGRERCEFLSFKDFNEPWDRQSQSRVLAARPMQNTRMGTALRHAGYHLSQLAARRKLIMMFSDGQPLDHDYDPQSRYAQHDVRMACLENKGLGIVTFCVSTLENSRQDMELMFPDQRYVILHNIRQLRRILPRFYMKLTI